MDVPSTGHSRQMLEYYFDVMNEEKSGVWQTPETAKKQLSIKTKGNP